MTEGPSGEEAPASGPVVRALLEWFRHRPRDVPWRDESEPYRIWVAEVMAQQTRIATVRDYYDDFLERFPDVEALADAPLDDVLKAWEGLGYYARARNLHRAAGQVVEEYGGRVPETPERLRQLPGVGPYTAGAIASIAYGRPEPTVDGNTRRVMSRLHDLPDPSRGTLEEMARRLLAAAPDRPAKLNQALMDLGGQVCTPRSPDCGACPLSGFCLARARGTVELRPGKNERGPLPHHDVAAGVVWHQGRVLIQRRPEEGLLGGLWEFPGGKVEEGETPADAVRRELWEETGLEVEVGELVDRVEHAYSHFQITLYAYHARRLSGEPRPRAATDWAWVRPAAMEEYAFPAANRRILEALG